MEIEYEATFENVDKEEIRKKLGSVGAKLVKKEFLMKRNAFNLPKGHEIEGGWLRVRDEDDKITMSLKIVTGKNIENQKEIMLKIDDFGGAVKMLEMIGCENKAYQETRREIWMLDDVEIMIDEWPFLEPLVEIEGKSEERVSKVADKLGFDYSKAIFESVEYLYNKKYSVSIDRILNHTPRIVFGEKNPFTD